MGLNYKVAKMKQPITNFYTSGLTVGTKKILVIADILEYQHVAGVNLLLLQELQE